MTLKEIFKAIVEPIDMESPIEKGMLEDEGIIRLIQLQVDHTGLSRWRGTLIKTFTFINSFTWQPSIGMINYVYSQGGTSYGRLFRWTN